MNQIMPSWESSHSSLFNSHLLLYILVNYSRLITGHDVFPGLFINEIIYLSFLKFLQIHLLYNILILRNVSSTVTKEFVSLLLAPGEELEDQGRPGKKVADTRTSSRPSSPRLTENKMAAHTKAISNNCVSEIKVPQSVENAYGVDYNPVLGLYATFDYDVIVSVWNPVSGKVVAQFRGFGENFLDVLFVPEGLYASGLYPVIVLQ